MFTADLYGKTRRVINRKMPLALLEKEKGSLEKPIGSGGKKEAKRLIFVSQMKKKYCFPLHLILTSCMVGAEMLFFS